MNPTETDPFSRTALLYFSSPAPLRMTTSSVSPVSIGVSDVGTVSSAYRRLSVREAAREESTASRMGARSTVLGFGIRSEARNRFQPAIHRQRHTHAEVSAYGLSSDARLAYTTSTICVDRPCDKSTSCASPSFVIVTTGRSGKRPLTLATVPISPVLRRTLVPIG